MVQSGNLMMFHTAISDNRIVDLLLLRFPSKLRDIPEQQWYLDLGCDNIESATVCMDDSQDLLIFISSVDYLCLLIRLLTRLPFP